MHEEITLLLSADRQTRYRAQSVGWRRTRRRGIDERLGATPFPPSRQ